ncbi:hypothetical protein D3C72_1057700 [compost metagenome]
MGPPWNARIPAAAASPITTSRACLSSPQTSTSQSMGLSASASKWAEMFWKAETTFTFSPSICCRAATAEPDVGSCTRATLGGTSGTVTSTKILPSRKVLTRSAVEIWAENGTVITTMSARAAAASLAMPTIVEPPRRALSLAAASAALSAVRLPSKTW